MTVEARTAAQREVRVPGTKRERQLARERYERQLARRAETRARARRRQQVIGAVAGVLAVIAGVFLVAQLLGDDDVRTEPAAAPSPSSSPVCQAVPPAPKEPKKFKAEPRLVVTPKKYEVTLLTNCGEIVLSLDAAKAPRAVNSFLFLAGRNYFDGSPCHRLTTNNLFVLQCGDPTGTGSGGPGYTFADENLPKAGDGNYPMGTLAMANRGKGTNGSQFFLVYKNSTLPPDFTVFGKVVAGQHVLDKVALGGVEAQGSADGAPRLKVSIVDVKARKEAT
jgi:peptidyl-prolyl cis-trans isomerase B (cyclophilin B)